ncbi:hypothetical protein [Millisia brevis]|uniref:hypothetical protein n=1 Tax=Millisia brevis TaxID=264148 RepID=UPI00082D0DBE|nr:hypothetical protein [Millisia brevis]
MSDGPVTRWLTSRKNLAGMAGALAGSGLAFVGVEAWPLAAAALYGVGALLAPSERKQADSTLTDQLRLRADLLDDRVRRETDRLPAGVPAAVRRMTAAIRVILDRLDHLGDQLVTRTGDPERLAVVEEIVGGDLPRCIDAYLGRRSSSSQEHAANQLAAQLGVIAGAIERLAASTPDVDVERAEDLTRELRRRHGDPEP